MLLAVAISFSVFSSDVAAQAPSLQRDQVRPTVVNAIDLDRPFISNGIRIVPSASASADCIEGPLVTVVVETNSPNRSREYQLAIDLALTEFGEKVGVACPSVNQVLFSLSAGGIHRGGRTDRRRNWVKGLAGALRIELYEAEYNEVRNALWALSMPAAGTQHPLSDRGYFHSIEIARNDRWTLYRAWPSARDFAQSNRHRSTSQEFVMIHEASGDEPLLAFNRRRNGGYGTYAGGYIAELNQVFSGPERHIGTPGSVYHYVSGMEYAERRTWIGSNRSEPYDIPSRTIPLFQTHYRTKDNQDHRVFGGFQDEFSVSVRSCNFRDGALAHMFFCRQTAERGTLNHRLDLDGLVLPVEQAEDEIYLSDFDLVSF